MGAFDHLLSSGFDLLIGLTDPPTISTRKGTADVLGTPIAISKEMQGKGFWPESNGVVELKRADYLRLGITDRTTVTYRHCGASKMKLALRVIGIEDDGADPCVRLTLKAEPGGKEG